MLTNRPEFHLIDTAAMHLGATPFSIYNTSSPEQIAYLLDDAGNRVFVAEAAFLERARGPRSSTAGQVEHLIVVDGARRRDDHASSELEVARARGRLRLRGGLAGGRSPTTC